MYETLLRPHEVQQLSPPRPLNDIIDKLRQMEHYREEKRQRQIKKNAGKRKREEEEQEAEKEQEDEMGEMGLESGRPVMEGETVGAGIGTGIERGTEKRARVGTEVSVSVFPALEESDEREEGSRRETVQPPALPEDDGTTTVGGGAVAGPSQAQVPAKLNCSKVSPDVRGHTSYLTFARLVPLPPSNSIDAHVS